MTRSRRALGLATLVVLFGTCVFVFSGGLAALLAEGGRTVRAQFDTTARLSTGSPVRVQGVEVGRVDSMHLEADGRTTNVEMVLYDDAPTLYRDATAAITWRTLLGGNYAITLEPGRDRAGALPGDTIPARQTSSQVEFDELLRTFDHGARGGLRSMLAEVPRALADPRAPGRALDAVATHGTTLARGVRAVRGRRPGDLQRLVTNVSRTVAALDTRGTTMRDVIEGAAATTTVTARRAADLQRTLVRGAGALPEIRATMGDLTRTLRLADPVLANLRRSSPSLAPTATRLRALALDAERLLVGAEPALRQLRPAAKALAHAANDARPVLTGLEPILRRLDDNILPDLAKRDPVTKRATYEMIGPTIAGLDEAAGTYDRVSHIVSLTAGGGFRPVDTLPCRTYFGSPSSAKVLACESLARALPALFGAQPGRGRSPR